MVQNAPAPNVVGQSLVWLNSPKSCTPPIAMVPIAIAALVLLVMVTGRGALAEPSGTFPKAKVVVDDDMVTPTPVSGTVWVPVTSLSVMVRVPATGPGTVGLKVTLMLQLPPVAIVPTQLLFCWKGPVSTTLVTLSDELLALLSVTTLGVPVVPTIWLPKFTFFADRPTPLPTPLRVRV